MNKDILHKNFEYKDGHLIYKIKTSNKIKIGDIAGSVNKKGYIQISLASKLYLAHRAIWIYHYGNIPNNMQIDHINGVKSDNRIENLRLATNQQNQFNIFVKKNNKSGQKGVSKKNNKWRARIKINGNEIYLGSFDKKEDAIFAYQNTAKHYHKEYLCKK